MATVDAADVAEALDLAWWTFRKAAGEDLAGWDLARAAAEVRPEASLAGPEPRAAGAGGDVKLRAPGLPLQRGRHAEHVSGNQPRLPSGSDFANSSCIADDNSADAVGRKQYRLTSG